MAADTGKTLTEQRLLAAKREGLLPGPFSCFSLVCPPRLFIAPAFAGRGGLTTKEQGSLFGGPAPVSAQFVLQKGTEDHRCLGALRTALGIQLVLLIAAN